MAYVSASPDLSIGTTRSTRKGLFSRALDRLIELVKVAAVRPEVRRPTRPTLASKIRRGEAKERRSGVKRLRTSPPVE